jgi:hypothetical protein
MFEREFSNNDYISKGLYKNNKGMIISDISDLGKFK